MSYQVIALKWRPQVFQQIIGQEHITQTLLNALENKQVPHAILFTGCRGVGKTSAARILAKSLKCSQTPHPCNKCSVCKEITKGSHIDVMEIDGASHNGVDAMREIIDKVHYMPFQGQYKICIIDEVHMLSSSAFNALLKTLEEPPSHQKFIFATTEVQKIPHTILSRCQKFYFRPIPTTIISKHLEKICHEEKINYKSDALWLIARQGEGSMRDAQSLLDQIATFVGRDQTITSEKVIEILSLADRKLILETLEAILEQNSLEILNIISRLYNASYDLKTFINDLMESLKHLLFIKECSAKDISSLVDIPDVERDTLQQLAKKATKSNIHLLFDMALTSSLDIIKARDGKIVLEMLLLRMVHTLKDTSDLTLSQKDKKSLTKTLNTPQIKQSSENANIQKGPSPQMLHIQPLPQPSVQTHQTHQTHQAHQVLKETNLSPLPPRPQKADHIKDKQTVKEENIPSTQPLEGVAITSKHLKNFILYIKQKSPLLGAQLEHVSLNKVEGGQNHHISLFIPPDREFLLSQLNSNQTLKKIQEHALIFWKKNVKFDFKVAQKNASYQSFVVKSANKQKELLEKAEKLPITQKLKSTLGAEVQSVVEISTQQKT